MIFFFLHWKIKCNQALNRGLNALGTNSNHFVSLHPRMSAVCSSFLARGITGMSTQTSPFQFFSTIQSTPSILKYLLMQIDIESIICSMDRCKLKNHVIFNQNITPKKYLVQNTMLCSSSRHVTSKRFCCSRYTSQKKEK